MTRKNGNAARLAVASGALALAAIAFDPSTASADDVKRATNEAGVGLATAVANVFYIPAKIGYAALGSVTGGLGYVLTGGNKDVADRVWVSSLGGDYIVTRDQLKGEQAIHFSGTSDPDM